MTAKPKKPYWEMSTAELAAATAEFDKSLIIDSFHPLSAPERAQWSRLKRKRGRPRVGRGAKVVSMSIEGGLLDRIDRAARRLKISRAKFMSGAARRVLAEVESMQGPKPRGRKRAA